MNALSSEKGEGGRKCKKKRKEEVRDVRKYRNKWGIIDNQTIS